MIQTFIYEPSRQDGNRITIDGLEAKHMSSVLRLGQGETVRLIDGHGTAHICEIQKTGSKKIICGIIRTVKNSGEPALDLTLAVGLSTGSKFDTVIEKGTEVGVARFVPLLTDKSKVKIGDSGNVKRKMNRWERVCTAAAKQSGRSIVPPIDHPVRFDEFISGVKSSAAIIFHPDEKATALAAVLETLDNHSLTILIGPESGFSPGEIKLGVDRGISIISLGERVLRTETAGIVLSALTIYQYEILNR